MERWPDVGKRIAEEMKRAGYWNPRRDRPDVLRFCLERGYLPTYLYKWLEDQVTPSREHLYRLAEEFGVSVAWLLCGEGKREATKSPVPPRKRARKVLGCLLGALSLNALAGATAIVRAQPDPLSVAPSIVMSSECASYRKWLLVSLIGYYRRFLVCVIEITDANLRVASMPAA